MAEKHMANWMFGFVVNVAVGLALAFPLTGQVPTVDKVEPPGWVSALPSPMLLIRGTGLAGATFSGTPITRTLTSPNGHWAMLWLNTNGIGVSTLHITANTQFGSTSFEFKLKPRRKETGQGVSGFSPADVMMCIMPDRFARGDIGNKMLAGMPPIDRADPHSYHGGDIKGVIDHLDYLQELGVTAVWLTPIVANNQAGKDYHGYGATDLYAVDPRLGTLADYQRLAAELHRRHMKLIFDDVPNHVGPAHPWTADQPFPDWFHGNPQHHIEATYEFGKITDPHLAESAARGELDGWFANTLPDMNQENPLVAEYELQNMIWWIEETGLDALRIDTFPFVPRSFWQGYLSSLQALYPHLNFVGEVYNEESTITAFFAGSRTIAGIDTHLTTPFDYPYFFALRDVLLKGKPFSALEKVFRNDWLYPHPDLLVPILDNHDTRRFMSEAGANPELFRIATGITLTIRGTPQLYIGDELLMEGRDDPDNRRDFPGGFPGDKINSFVAGGRTPQEAGMHDFTAALGQLRAHTPALQGGAQQDVVVENDAFAFVRTPTAELPSSACSPSFQSRSVLIAVNRASHADTLIVPAKGNILEGCSTLKHLFGDSAAGTKDFTITLPPFGFAIYTID